MAFFIPLSVLPLVIMAILFLYLVTNSLEFEVGRRAVSEQASVMRTLEQLEKTQDKKLLDWLKKVGTKISLEDVLTDAIEGDVRALFKEALIENIRVFNSKGDIVYDRKHSNQEWLDTNWSKFFAGRGDSSPAAKEFERSRKPASPEQTFWPFAQERYQFPDKKLAVPFVDFLKNELTFIYRDLSAKRQDTGFDILLYRYVNQSLVEARVHLSSRRLGQFARFQGVDLLFMSPAFKVVASSTSEDHDEMNRQLNLISKDELQKRGSLEIQLTTKGPADFFFTPIEDEFGQRLGWVSVGLSKINQILLTRKIFIYTLILSISLSMIVILLVRLFAKNITRPVSDLVNAAERMRQGQHVEPVVNDTNTEIGFLIDRFNQMTVSVQVSKRALEAKLDELAQAHAELKNTQTQLIQSAKMSSLGQLVAGVAHELNNPIAFIYSNMNQMKDHLQSIEKLNELFVDLQKEVRGAPLHRMQEVLRQVEWDFLRTDLKDIVKSCLEGSLRVKDIVLNLRNFSRSDLAEIQLADINEKLRDTVKLLGGQIKNRIEVHWDMAEDAVIECYASQLNQVFVNLISNASQAIESQGHIWISTKRLSVDKFEIRIRDNGSGIPQDIVDRIFDPFFTTKKVGEGTGLGLSIVYGIVEKHSGQIHVNSRIHPLPEHGTEFVLTLPTKQTGKKLAA